MITEEEQRLETLGNKQVEAMNDVLGELREKSKMLDFWPDQYYWFRYVDYVQVDRCGDLEAWSTGHRGYPDEPVSGYSFVVDGQLLVDGDVQAFKQRFRADTLPYFNKARAAKVKALEDSILEAQKRIPDYKGDIA